MSDIHHLVAPTAWRQVDFISDIHLNPFMPLTAALWRHYLLTTQADAIFILGDLFEAWIGDDLLDISSPTASDQAAHTFSATSWATLHGLAQFAGDCAQTLARTSIQRKIYVMHGNRDFLIGDHFAHAAHVILLPEPSVLTAFGASYTLCHGDAQCWDDLPYMRARAQVRQPAWQQAILQRPLPERLALAQTLREDKSQQPALANAALTGLDAWVDLNPTAIAELMRATQAQTLIHGHTHLPDVHRLDDGLTRWVLSDWDVDTPKALHRASVLQLSGAGLNRISLLN